MAVSKEFIVQLQGRDFVLFAGLLDAATKAGLKSTSTDVIQVPSPDNGRLAVVQATVEFADGRTFQATGDASPESVGRMIAPHILRMAETRAIGRALRWALNVAVTMKEELGGDEDAPQNGYHAASEAKPAPQRARHDPQDHAERKAAQESAAALCEACGDPVPAPVATAARKAFGRVLCIPCGRAQRDADKERPAQMQGA